MDSNKNAIINIDDETDEFEVISREEEENGDSKTYGIAYKQTPDEASTVCDEEEGLDRAENSAVPSRCESLLHSMCSLAPFNAGIKLKNSLKLKIKNVKRILRNTKSFSKQ